MTHNVQKREVIGARIHFDRNHKTTVAMSTDKETNEVFLDHIVFERATQDHYVELVNLCVNEFSKAETHCKALHFSSPACIPIFERLVNKSIQCPQSIVATDKRSGEIIGFRLMSVAYRIPPADEQSTDLVITERGCLLMMEMLGLVKQIIFDQFPDVHKVLSRDLSFVLPKVQKKGVGAKMVEELLLPRAEEPRNPGYHLRDNRTGQSETFEETRIPMCGQTG